jgi:DNA-binding MarR family transcriptional regulator
MLAVDELQRYVKNQLHVPLHLVEWSRQAALPAFLRTQYKFFEGRLVDARVLLAVSLSDLSVRGMNVHRETLERYSPLPVVFVLDRITPGMRRSLIAAKIPFIVPGTQLYLPFLGLSLQERFRPRQLEHRRLSPSAQAALLYVLLHSDLTESTPTEMAAVLGYTSMAMVRAFDQLEAATLIHASRVDRQRVVTLAGSRLEVWDRAQPLLASPVSKRIWISAETLGNSPASPAWPGTRR